MRLQDKVGIVTGAGGAGGSGLGAAIARAMAREGARVVVTDILDAEAEKVAAGIREDGGDALALTLDVTDDTAWATVVRATIADHGRLDMLVNSAGIAAFGVNPLDLPTWEHVFTTNTRGAFLGMRHAIPEIASAGGGAVVNITSAAGSVGVRGMHMGYGAAKAAIRQMTRVAAVEFAADGVRVNAVAPGMLERRPGAAPSGAPRGDGPAERTREAAATIPLGRVGRADDIASVVVFALSDEASYVTGTELLADGGYLALG
jgi:NAD(P)-dependent dehydrogenase (short-subunit alcohol dehydrogenase family)